MRAWATYVTGVREAADAESAAYRRSVTSATVDRQMIVVLVTVAICLTLNNFLAANRDAAWLVTLLDRIGLSGPSSRLASATTTSDHAELNRLVFWGAVQVAGYVVLPVVVIACVFRERLRDYGLLISGIGRHVRPYVVLLICSLPALVAVSYTSAFQERYPFLDLVPGVGLWPDMWMWWGVYAAQFVALEFFFRGFFLHGLKRRFGWGAIFVMVVPYNMLHYGKPMAEALAAIVGGCVLGTLSLKTRSIWWGAALHVAIAGSMDVLALWHKGIVF
ncbi:MAG: CPBP family intramembrane metalloprotease [Acidimicrobiia bacterium]|nr:CPBP family intramembrane metalloprotease [Acidimicrobiia bacterium]